MRKCLVVMAAVLLSGVAQAKPSFEKLDAKAHATRVAQWRAEIKARLHVPATLPALETRTWSKFAVANGVTAERVTYNTVDGMIVPAIVYSPAVPVKAKMPGIVIVNGHGSDKFGWYAFWSGIAFARAGSVVVTYDMIGEGERNSEKKSPGGSHDKTPLGYGTRLAGLMQVDLMQAVSYLDARKDVDPKRVAVLGFSMGSLVAGIAGALDPRIHAVVLSGGGVFDGPGGYYDVGKLPCQMPPYRALLSLDGGVFGRGPILMALNAENGPMYVMNGLVDTTMDIPHHDPAWFSTLHEETLELTSAEATKNVFETVFYPGVAHRPSWVNRDGFLWLEDHLHFELWSRKQIEEAPLTHISEWIQKNNVAISKGALKEDHEGGIQAVGNDVPGVRREELMVLPPADWERLKDKLTWEAWEAKMEKLPMEPVADVAPAKDKGNHGF